MFNQIKSYIAWLFTRRITVKYINCDFENAGTNGIFYTGTTKTTYTKCRFDQHWKIHK